MDLHSEKDSGIRFRIFISNASPLCSLKNNDCQLSGNFTKLLHYLKTQQTTLKEEEK